MNLLIGLLFAKAIGTKKVKSKQVSRKIRKEASFWVEVIVELVQLIHIIFKFLFKTGKSIYNKCFCKKVIDEVKLPKNVVDFTEYKLKKAK